MVCYKKSDSKFRSWLSVVIRNIVYSYHKSSKRHRAQSLVDSEGNDMDFHEKLSVEPEIDQMIEKEWKGYITKMAFSRIKPLFSDNAIKILQMSLAGKKHAEISESLDIKLSSVKVLKSRVKARFEEEVRSLVANLESES
jgi:RNA polymerase sigma factor (sigma-70 family)